MNYYSKFLSLINGVGRTVDLSNNNNVLELGGGGLQLNGSTSGNITMLAAATTSPDYSIIWPAAQAAGSGYVLSNDGSGNLSWIPAASGSVTSISIASANGFAGSSSGGATPILTIQTTVTGLLQGNGTAISAYTGGNLTDVGTDGITITGGTGAVIGGGTTISQHVADTSHNGYLSSTDWNTFNGKQAAGNYITALTGDVTASGPGSAAATLATVNSNVGSFGSSTSIPSFTVNAKGLITAASGNAVVAPAGTLTGTTLASNVINSSLTSLGTQSQALDMGSNQINNVSDPTNPQDAATKHYVDLAVAGIQWKDEVQAYAASNVPLTGGATLTVDGYSVQNGDSVILANQTTTSQNGVYTASGIGTAYTLTLRSDSNPPSLGFAYLVVDGTTYAYSSWVVSALSPTMFVQFAGPQELVFDAPLSRTGNDVSLNYSNGLTLSGSNLVVQASDSSITVASGGISVAEDAAGAIVTGGSGIAVQVQNGIQITGNHLDIKVADTSLLDNSSGLAVNLATSSGLVISSGLAVNPDGSTLDINGGNHLEVKAGGITETQINNSALSSTGALAGGSGTKLSVKTDGSTIDINGSDQLEVKAAGISATQLATGAFDQVTILGGAGTAAHVAYAPAVEVVALYDGAATLAAHTTYAMRWGIPDNSETADRLYVADWDTSSFDLFWVVGLFNSSTTTATGASITVVNKGSLTLGSSDTVFGSTDQGKPVWLGSAGAFTPNSTFSPSSGDANEKLGIVSSSTSIYVDCQMLGVS